MIRRVWLALAGLCLAAGVNASVLYDNTTGTSFTSSPGLFFDGVLEIVAETFSVPTPGVVQSINFWVWEQQPTAGADTLTNLHWYISPDNAGAVSDPSYPFNLIAIASGNGTAFPGTFISSHAGYDLFEESIDTGALALTPGAQYYLYLTNAQSSKGPGDFIAWDISNGGSTGYLSNDQGATGHGVQPSESFQILDVAATPEPGSWLLLAAGLTLFALLYAQRKRNLLVAWIAIWS